VGTFKFADFLKDRTDRFEGMELIFYPPAPAPTAVAESTAPPEVPTPELATDAPVAATEALAMTKDPVESEQEPLSDMSEDSAKGTDSDSPAAEAEDAAAGQPDKVEEEGPPAEPDESTKVMSAPEPAELAEPPASLPTPAAPSWSDEEKASWQARDEAAVQVGGAFGRGVNLARALIAQPASVCTPTYLAKTAETMAKKYGFGYQSFGVKELEKQGFVGHIAVGAGSANSPKMFEMSYEPATPSAVHLVLVGKGVTFDTGGISIKTADKMHLMVGDMSGAAAVMGTMDILGQLRPNIKVSAVIVSAENSPDGKSFRPGDILRYKNGLSVHIENTDAEGRLLLADGLIRAGELGATHVIDIATLTGSCYRALGPSFTGVMGVNRKLVNAITRAGGNHGESYWRLPLPVEYRSMLKTIHADLNNIGGANAGATTAGLFLQEFVPPRTVWAHLDIAGTFWKSKAWKYYQEGPSGTGVKTLADLALRWNEHMT
jgi:leucyl aminopeptidase